jgi:hypothetical protein
MRPVRTEIVSDIAAIPAADWNSLTGAGYPFMRHEFLAALESSGSASAASGWRPAHLALRDESRQLVGAMPMYLKSNSMGEFVFDWAWADAYRRAGLRYYPKLVAAVPFTPATSPRLLHRADADAARIQAQLLAGALQAATGLSASSLHVLFPAAGEMPLLTRSGLLPRKDCQFHWHNHDYADFEGFLAAFTAEKRKKARRERRRVAEAGITFRHLHGDEIDAALWEQLLPLYASSFWRRGREPYLNAEFFLTIGRTLPRNLLVIVALHQQKPVACAICYRSDDVLYGRYWGSAGDYHSLHFETCYYQGIDYCISHGLRRFEPGTQGEHKISRGFVPTETWSAHWLSDARFAAAVDDYLDRERTHIDRYIDAAGEHVPFRRDRD